jgi:glycolate oxidase FAD binding subunit
VILNHVRALLGPEAIRGTGSQNQPLVAPADDAAVALLLRTASAEGWQVGLVGAGRWCPSDCPADLLLTTRQLDRVPHVSPADLVTTVEAGTSWTQLRSVLADRGVWVASDHPGPDRTVGSVVVKNVAGYDLTKLAIGSFGAFGVVTSVTLRLRAVPRADTTLVAVGKRDDLIDTALAVSDAGLTPSALELFNAETQPPGTWTLAARLTGRDAAVLAASDTIRQVTSIDWAELASSNAAELWSGLHQGAVSAPTTLRLGVLPTAIEPCLDLVQHYLREGTTGVSMPLRVVRWCGHASADDVRRLRYAAAQQEMPLTLERASWALRSAVGHFGAYREGTGRLIAELRRAFDPRGVLVVPLGSDA